MNLPKAIEINTLMLKAGSRVLSQDEKVAIKIAIEASEAVLKIRHYPFPEEILHLPSETED